MWSYFSRDPTKGFAYDIGAKVPGLEERSIWSLHEGKHKTTGEAVSIFAFDIKGSSESQLQLAKAALKRTKTLRHPNILTYVDGLESDKVLYIVTEAVVPLETHIGTYAGNDKQSELAISWGLHQIVKGLSFLINDCNLIHNNVCMSSIFVDKAGEWKLGGVDYMYPASGPESIPPVKILPALEKYDPPEKSDPNRGRKPTEKWSSDMWGLGILIWEVFNGNLPRNSSLKSLGKIPKNLVPHYCELVGANPKSRPNPARFIQNCCANGSFMDNKFVYSVLFLEEIQIKDQHEKTQFFNTLTPVLDTFPPLFCRMKILPQLLHAFEFGNAGSAVLAPLFKIGKSLDSEEYQAKIVPCVVKLFTSTDRATRVKLLQEMDQFVEHLNPAVVNDKIFPNVVQGFMDTNPVVREHTIKAMLHLAAKLNYKNLNEELLKHFARLQTKDDQGGIRTNTTVCLGKIACHLNPQTRQKILSSAYLRSMKDPFPPARQAGILAMGATHNYFTLAESANQLLPCLCRMTMDPDQNVRDQAFKAIKCFLGKLEKASQNPESIPDLEKDVLIGGSAASSAAGWAGWAMTGMTSITSKLYRTNKPPGSAPNSSVAKAPSAGSQGDTPANRSHSNNSSRESSVDSPSEAKRVPPEPVVADAWGDDDAGGWDDEDWGNMEDNAPASEESGQQAAEFKEEDGWDDDDWGSIEDTGFGSVKEPSFGASSAMSLKKAEPSPWGDEDFAPVDDTPATGSYDWGEPATDDFFGSMLTDKPGKSKSRLTTKPSNKAPAPRTTSKASAKPVQSSSVTSSSITTSGWDDDSGWGDDGDWGKQDDWQDTGPSEADLAKQKREEKKAQRRKEMEERKAARATGGGAMKLGARKLAKD